MELDLLGLGLPPATAAAVGHGAGQRPHESAAFDEPLRFAAAAPETPSRVRARMRRRAVGRGDDVHAPPASRLRPSAPASWPAQVRVPGAAGDGSPRASQLGSFRGMFPSTPSELAQAHANATGAQAPSAPAANGFGRPPPPFSAGLVFQGSAAASSSINPDHSTAPLTIIYAGSVRAFDSVPAEQAEKILSMTANGAQAAEIPAFQQPGPGSGATLPSTEAQMMMLLGLANVRDSLLPKRTASLARFLHKRKQRVGSAAKMPYRGEDSTAVYARNKAPFGDMKENHGPESMKENHGEEAVNTELKI